MAPAPIAGAAARDDVIDRQVRSAPGLDLWLAAANAAELVAHPSGMPRIGPIVMPSKLSIAVGCASVRAPALAARRQRLSAPIALAVDMGLKTRQHSARRIDAQRRKGNHPIFFGVRKLLLVFFLAFSMADGGTLFAKRSPARTGTRFPLGKLYATDVFTAKLTLQLGRLISNRRSFSVDSISFIPQRSSTAADLGFS